MLWYMLINLRIGIVNPRNVFHRTSERLTRETLNVKLLSVTEARTTASLEVTSVHYEGVMTP